DGRRVDLVTGVQTCALPILTNEFDWVQAGSAGTLALAWYGVERAVPGGSDAMPSSLTDLGGATQYPWYGYAALVTKADTSRPLRSEERRGGQERSTCQRRGT